MAQRTLDILIDRGVIDRERVTTKPTHRHCKTCRRVVLTALADDGPDVAGIRTTATARRLTPLGELQALSTGRLTYFVKGGLMSWRDPCTIRQTPANQIDVYASHKCGQDDNLDYRPDDLKELATPRTKGTDICPF